MDLLAIYLNDHLAGATAARELVRRAASRNRGSDYGRVLERLAAEIDEDRDALLAIMRALGRSVDQLKVLGGWGAEKLGRFKPGQYAAVESFLKDPEAWSKSRAARR